jgi:hypothetical protein
MTPLDLQLLCRVVILFVFCLSAGTKVRNLGEFEVTIADFEVLPRRWSGATARLVLATEGLIAIFFVTGGALIPTAFFLAIILLSIFSFALTSALRRKLKVGCSCFGRTEVAISSYDVARNVALVLLSAIGLGTCFARPQIVERHNVILLALMGITTGMFIINLDEIVRTLVRPFPSLVAKDE